MSYHLLINRIGGEATPELESYGMVIKSKMRMHPPSVTVGKSDLPAQRPSKVIKMLRDLRFALEVERSELKKQPPSRERDYRLAELTVEMHTLTQKMREASDDDPSNSSSVH